MWTEMNGSEPLWPVDLAQFLQMVLQVLDVRSRCCLTFDTSCCRRLLVIQSFRWNSESTGPWGPGWETPYIKHKHMKPNRGSGPPGQNQKHFNASWINVQHQGESRTWTEPSDSGLSEPDGSKGSSNEPQPPQPIMDQQRRWMNRLRRRNVLLELW